MDNKQAIEELKTIKQNHIDLNYRFRHLYDDYIIALDKAIASLKKVEELEKWNKVLEDRIDFFEEKQGCKDCASNPLGDYVDLVSNIEYLYELNRNLVENWNNVKKEIKEIETTDVNRCKTMAVHIINKYLEEGENTFERAW